MRAVAPEGGDARAVLRAVRAAVEGAGPAVLLGGTDAGTVGGGTDVDGAVPVATDVPAGTAVVVTTSGSTGYPKRVVLSRTALAASAFATAERIGTGAWLLALSPTYVAGLQVLVRALLAGHEPAVLAGHFTPAGFVAAANGMASHAGGRRIPSYTSLVPAQLATLVEAADDPDVGAALASFEAILVGGQALPEPLRERALARGARIVRTYGSSETSGGCVYEGSPLPGVGARILAGEVQLSGPTLADGYLGEPERTDAAFIRDADGTRWYRTGDAGTLEGALLTVTGRVDNVIISGGINVSLDRVERVVRGLPGLAAAVVVPIADERWGQGSAVVVAAAPGGEDAQLVAVREAVGAAIGAPARPARLIHLPELPVLTSGKPDRVALRRLLEP